ncbi:MAG: hypothetical protein JXX14_14095 [Deltaproteobacteria bacterium]|nr:hypothetical protein [Deltaproteobacteria bacterium]
MRRHLQNGFEFIPMLVLILLALTLGASGRAQSPNPEPIYVIANKGFPADALTASQAKRIFLKQQRSVNGTPVMPINARRTSLLRKQFDERLLQMTVVDELSYWEDQKMQHGMQVPTEIRDTVRAVFSAPIGISYCFQSEFKASAAKILLKI